MTIQERGIFQQRIEPETEKPQWVHIQQCKEKGEIPRFVPLQTFAFLVEVADSRVGEDIDPTLLQAVDSYYGTNIGIKSLRTKIPSLGAERVIKRNILGTVDGLYQALAESDPTVTQRYPHAEVVHLKINSSSTNRKDTTDDELWNYAKQYNLLEKLVELGVLTSQDLRKLDALFSQGQNGSGAFPVAILEIVSVAVAQHVADIPLKDKTNFLASLPDDRREKELETQEPFEDDWEEEEEPEENVIFSHPRRFK